MAETSGIADHIDPNATGKVLGGYKNAARRAGCSLDEWYRLRAAGRRWCYRCRDWRPGDDFQTDRSRLGGKKSLCRPCASDASIASRHGISPSELAEFRKTHGDNCGICERAGRLYVDHNHETGRLRGLLCPGCNSAIGLFNDDPALFAAALSYLEKSGG